MLESERIQKEVLKRQQESNKKEKLVTKFSKTKSFDNPESNLLLEEKKKHHSMELDFKAKIVQQKSENEVEKKQLTKEFESQIALLQKKLAEAEKALHNEREAKEKIAADVQAKADHVRQSLEFQLDEAQASLEGAEQENKKRNKELKESIGFIEQRSK